MPFNFGRPARGELRMAMRGVLLNALTIATISGAVVAAVRLAWRWTA